MDNLDIIRSFKIKAYFTASEWGLYAEDMDCAYATNQLNKTLEESVAIHTLRSETEREMMEAMHMYNNFGSNEEKAHVFLDGVLTFIYGATV